MPELTDYAPQADFFFQMVFVAPAPLIACLIGFGAGILVVGSILFLDRRGIDDPVGAISVHGVCGLF